MSDTDNSTIETDLFDSCCSEQDKKDCLEDILRIRQNDTNYNELHWKHRNVGDKGAKVIAETLAENSSVTKINLRNNKIGNDGAKVIAEALKKNSSVTKISLRYNEIGDDGAKEIAKALKKNSSVTYIDLHGNRIGVDGAKEIAQALKKNSSVTEIDLGNNQIGEDGAKAIAEALAENLSVTKFYLNNNQIGEDGAKAIAEALAENSSLTYLNFSESGYYISPANEISIKSFIDTNKILKKHQEDVQKSKDQRKEEKEEQWMSDEELGKDEDKDEVNKTETNPLPDMSYYVDGFSATSSQFHNDNNPQWKWTAAAWEAVNHHDGRIAQALLNCLVNNTNTIINFRESLMQLVETDFNNEQNTSLLHIAASKSYSKVFELLKFFIQDCKLKIDLTDEAGRSIRVIAIANDNREISAWARTFGTYLERYDIKGENGINSDPEHQSETCSVHFATDMNKKVTDPDFHVAIKIMNNEKNFERELNARLKSRNGIKAGDDIQEYMNMYDLDHVVSLYRYHDNAKDKDGNPCWCLVLTKGLKSLHQIIDTERIAGKNSDKIVDIGKDLAKAISHMHEKETIHADIKPRNVIRDSEGDIKLIDLDASVKVEGFLTVKKKSTAFISPELARIEFQAKETLDVVDKKMEEKLKERNELERKREYGETYNLLNEEIKVLQGKYNQIMNKSKETSLSNDTTSIPADFSLDIWGFGVTLYPLFTDKKNIFKANLSDDTLDGEDEKLRLVNWDGPSKKDLDKIVLDDVSIQKAARAFFEKCLHKDIDERFKSMNEVLKDPLFHPLYKIADDNTTLLKKIYDGVQGIPQKMLDVRYINCPYIFNFISKGQYNSFKALQKEKMGNNAEVSRLEYAANLTSKVNVLYEEAETLIGGKIPENPKDSKIIKGIMSKVRSKVLGEESTDLYLQILDGVTFEPVLSYKVSHKKYPDQVKSASKAGVKICNVLQNLSFISRIASIMGYPIPDISAGLGMAESFLTEIIKSGEAAEYITSLNFDGGGFENFAELDNFKTFLDDLVKDEKLRFCRGQECKNSKERKESWEGVMMPKCIKTDDGDDSFVTWIDKMNSGKLENYRKSI